MTESAADYFGRAYLNPLWMGKGDKVRDLVATDAYGTARNRLGTIVRLWDIVTDLELGTIEAVRN